MRADESPTSSPTSKGPEDKRLERLYDYTKFHIGIYLSAAGGVAALLGSKDAGWAISTLVGNQYLLYAAFAFMVLAGMCGGIVATSTTESLSFEEFWNGQHGPATVPSWKASGRDWVAREHGFFWASLLLLAAAVLVRYPGTSVPQTPAVGVAASCCCACQPPPSASAPASASKP